MKARPIAASDTDAAARLFESVHAIVVATPAPTLRTVYRTWIGITVVCVVTIITVAAASQLVYDELAAGLSVAVASPTSALQMGGLVLVLAVIATIIAMWRARAGFGLPQAALPTLAAAVAPIYAIIIIQFAPHAPSNLLVSPWGVRCLLIAALVGITALVSFAWALRRAVPEGVASRALAIGACAGAWAGVAVFFFCPSADQQHLLIGHVMPMVMLTVLSPIFLPRALRP